jgi:hypothetical protein
MVCSWLSWLLILGAVKKPQVLANPRLLNEKTMGLLPCPPMVSDAHLCTGLPVQPEGGLLKKEAATGKVTSKAGK